MIVEDDCDGEFNLEERPLQSLQDLDTEGRIVYIGTFSRTVSGAARRLSDRTQIPGSCVYGRQVASDLHLATLEQQSLAEFLTTAMYERHLRRLPPRNTARREAQAFTTSRHFS